MKYRFVAVLFSTIVLASCQKDTSFEVTQNASDSTALAQYIDFDTTLTQGQDTLAVSKYYYDSRGRLERNEYYQYSNGISTDLEQNIFFYGGDSIVPSKKTEVWYSLPSGVAISSLTQWLRYDASNRVVYDSVFDNISASGSSRNYSYNGFNIILSAQGFSRYFYLTKINGNTELQVDTLFGSYISNFQFSYDSKHNPFYKMPLCGVERSTPFYQGETYNDEMVYEPNNPVDINENLSSSGFHQTYVYTYNALGYPVKHVQYDESPHTYAFTRIYKYTKL